MRISQKARERIADNADDILERFTRMTMKNIDNLLAVDESMRALHELMDCDYHILDPDDKIGETQGGILDVDTTDAREFVETVFPMDYGVIVRKDNCYLITRMFGPVSPNIARGRTKMVSPVMAMLYRGALNDDGTWWAEENIMGLMAGRWSNLEAGVTRTTRAMGGTVETFKINDPGIIKNAAMITSMALSSRYDWHVALGGHKDHVGPRILLPSNPKGCLALLKDRDRPEGRERRASLRHWVINHYREQTPTEMSYVRDHLRGHTLFNWHGHAGEVFVSQFDLEKNEFFKDQADQWRAMRKHNRVKIKLKEIRR